MKAQGYRGGVAILSSSRVTEFFVTLDINLLALLALVAGYVLGTIVQVVVVVGVDMAEVFLKASLALFIARVCMRVFGWKVLFTPHVPGNQVPAAIFDRSLLCSALVGSAAGFSFTAWWVQGIFLAVATLLTVWTVAWRVINHQ